MTVDAKTTEKALKLRALGEATLVLPNAWDAGSAAVIEAAGASAIATTSGGVAWSIGRGDGQHATRAEMLAAAARIVAAVDVPVTVDIEGGYEDVAATVREVVAVGAVGINLEDSKAADGTLHTASEQAQRIRAA
ncbi:isocitrate lyase/phosphoenolpyruvate mutase family protein, partial [Streptomyces sp. NPDC059956]|uniref:isocitrate lyase/phosphoenolpyruvate mutase family protein n=1 Tax=Streptomyces sp. NPDC059956 TaxID=3347015 RepID=UPI00364FAD54